MKDYFTIPLLAAWLVSPVGFAQTPSLAFVDPLSIAATPVHEPARQSMVGMVRAGDRLVAVGPRGHILLSDDQGEQWRQAPVPVSTDLTAVYFPSPSQGWAVGHDGVVLHSDDGGEHWRVQLDGAHAARVIAEYYATPAMQDSLAPQVMAAVRESKNVQRSAPSLSLLGVWFRDDQYGFVVGAFNVVLHTEDGGATWTPWYERTQNPDLFHLYSVGGTQDEVYIVGERGLVMRLDPIAQRFVAVPTPYRGSFFGVLSSPHMVLVYGLRGNAYVSHDQGQAWSHLPLTTQATLLAAAVAGDGRVLLGSQRGELFSSTDQASSFTAIALPRAPAIYALAPLNSGGVVLAGDSGARVEHLDTEQHQ